MSSVVNLQSMFPQWSEAEIQRAWYRSARTTSTMQRNAYSRDPSPMQPWRASCPTPTMGQRSPPRRRWNRPHTPRRSAAFIRRWRRRRRLWAAAEGEANCINRCSSNSQTGRRAYARRIRPRCSTRRPCRCLVRFVYKLATPKGQPIVGSCVLGRVDVGFVPPFTVYQCAPLVVDGPQCDLENHDGRVEQSSPVAARDFLDDRRRANRNECAFQGQKMHRVQQKLFFAQC